MLESGTVQFSRVCGAVLPMYTRSKAGSSPATEAHKLHSIAEADQADAYGSAAVRLVKAGDVERGGG